MTDFSEHGAKANTIATWRARRLAKGRECTREHVVVRIKELWPSLTDDKIAEVADVSERPWGER